MSKSRRKYGIVLAVTALLLFCFGKRFLLFLLAAEFLLPVFLWLFLQADARRIKLELDFKPAGSVGKEQFLFMNVACRPLLLFLKGAPWFWAAGQIYVTVEYQNRLLDLVRREHYSLALRQRKDGYSVSFTPSVCGEEEIRIRKAVCVDLFGLCQADVVHASEKRRVIYPEPLLIQLIPGTMFPGNQEGERYSQSRKGMDASEIFDLREYHPGDDVRSIHWKLSGKTDTMIVRESSDTSHYDTVLLLDAGLKQGEKEWNKETLSVALGLGLTISEKLLELGMPHNVEMPVNQNLEDFPVGSRSEYQKIADIWMGMGLPAEQGMGIACFLMEKMESRFTKIIYVTAGSFPEQINSFSGNHALTAICVREAGETVRTAKRGSGQFLEIPYRILREQKNRIFI